MSVALYDSRMKLDFICTVDEVTEKRRIMSQGVFERGDSDGRPREAALCVCNRDVVVSAHLLGECQVRDPKTSLCVQLRRRPGCGRSVNSKVC